MSSDNLEKTKTIKKQTRTSQPAEFSDINSADLLPTDAQAETRVVKRKPRTTKSVQDGARAEPDGVPQKTDAPFVANANPEVQAVENFAVPSPESGTDESGIPPEEKDSKLDDKKNRRKWIWLGVLMVLMMVLAGSGIGYASAMRAREIEQKNQRLVLATTQYELGLVDQEQGKLGIAKKRFEYVLSIYPEFPGIEDKLVEIGLLIAQNESETIAPPPGPEPTPTVAITVVPTKSTGSTTLLYNQAKAQLEGQDWEGLYSTIAAMREIDPAYKAIEVDGMWYLALRNHGIRLIQGGQLEPGLYNFALAEHIAPIDADAESYRDWARRYLNAGSHWMVNWYAAVEGFAALYPLVPQLRDASGITVTQRYSRALIGYGDYLQSNYDFCGAAASYRQASSIYADATLPEKITQADEFCANPPATPTPTVDPNAPTVTPTP
jgi:hypothetical protein